MIETHVIFLKGLIIRDEEDPNFHVKGQANDLIQSCFARRRIGHVGLQLLEFQEILKHICSYFVFSILLALRLTRRRLLVVVLHIFSDCFKTFPSKHKTFSFSLLCWKDKSGIGCAFPIPPISNQICHFSFSAKLHANFILDKTACKFMLD